MKKMHSFQFGYTDEKGNRKYITIIANTLMEALTNAFPDGCPTVINYLSHSEANVVL